MVGSLPTSTGNSALYAATIAVGTTALVMLSTTNTPHRITSFQGTRKEAAIGAMIKLMAPTRMADIRPISRILAWPRSEQKQEQWQHNSSSNTLGGIFQAIQLLTLVADVQADY